MLPGVLIRLKPRGYQQLTVTNAAALPLVIPANTIEAIIVVENNAIRYRDDGTAPTTAIGMLISAGTVLEVAEDSLAAVRYIATAGDAILNVSYYG